MKLFKTKIALVTSAVVFGTIACSDNELLDPSSAEISADLEKFTEIPREDKFDSTWAPLEPNVGISSVAEVSSDASSSTVGTSSTTATSSDVTISSVVIGLSSTATSSTTQQSSTTQVSSVAASSAVQSSVAVSSEVQPSSSSQAPVSSVSQSGGTCASPLTFSTGVTYQTTDVVEYQGSTYKCVNFCNVPQGHNPITYGFADAGC